MAKREPTPSEPETAQTTTSSPPQPSPSAGAYAKRKESSRRRNADLSSSGRDIGEIPPVADPARRAACERDAEQFLRTYFPETFRLPFSDDHRRVIRAGQTAVLAGGLFAYAMPRGSGKTSICEGLSLWAVLYGHRAFLAIIGADKGLAEQILDSIRSELESNERLLADFPEVCVPIAALEGIANRCKGQLSKGERTLISWTRSTIILPTIAGSKASGAILKCTGITGRVRGLKHKRSDGSSIRPDLAICDDCQTDESANSPSQSEARERILAGAVLGLAGPGKQIAALAPCTVIRRGDMADRLLDREAHPEWHGERCKLIYELPTNRELWDRYGEIRGESLRGGGHGAEATEFYRQHQAEMDQGAVVAWSERYKPDELSAVQHAMNLLLTDEAAFWAEYQNDPKDLAVSEHELTPEAVIALASGLARRIAPLWASRLTAFVDVQRSLLYYAVIAWGDDFTGHVLDYGTCPQQRKAYFTLRDARPTLDALAPNAGLEAVLRAGLDALVNDLGGREWPREGGSALKIERLLVDANWGDSTNTVYEFCRRSPHAALLTPSHGKGVGASSEPLNQRKTKPKPGERIGLNWFMPIPAKRAKPYVLFDANFWKSFVAARMQVPAGGVGRLSLFGKPDQHRLFADHCTAERGASVANDKTGRTVVEWRLKSIGRDNHFWDCLVGAAVAASMAGCALAELAAAKTAGATKPVSYAELYQRARAKDDKKGPRP